MDYGKILSRAWQITWRWKVLWILGFLASIGSGSGGGGGNANTSFSGDGTGTGDFEWPFANVDPNAIIGILIGLACVFVLIGLVLWVLSIIARGGLIAGVREVEDEGRTTLGSAWRAGVRRFWTLFGITFLMALPILILVVILVGLVVASIAGAGIGVGMESDPAAVLGALGPWVICGIPLCCGIFIIGWIVGVLQQYADRAAMLEGLGWIDAVKRGWDVLRANLGPTIIFWLITLVIGLAIGLVTFALIAAIALPLIGLFMAAEGDAWTLIPICGGGLLGFIVISLLSAVATTFTSAAWTLVYRQLTGLPAQPAAVPPAPPELAEL